MGIRSIILTEFPAQARALNGFCALSNNTLIAADSFANCIWRVDLTFDTTTGAPKVAMPTKWYSHPSMNAKLHLPDFQPGTNGLKYSKKMQCVYYTSTQQRLFCRVGVDLDTLEAKGEAEVIAEGWQWDDLILDDRDDAEVRPMAYVTTHRDNTIVRVPLDLANLEATKKETSVVVQGGEEMQDCLGPTSGVWETGQEGKRALFCVDGGVKHPLKDGMVRCAKVIRVEFGE